jgi:predicted membrane metal-binding protein
MLSFADLHRFLTGLITISLDIFIPAIFLGVLIVVVGKIRYRVNLFLLILFLLLGGVRANTYSLSFCEDALAVKEIYGEVVSYPKFTNYSQQVTVRATGIGAYIVYLERYPEFLPGDILLLTDLVITPYTEKEVGYQKYLRSEGICGIISRPSKVSLTSQNKLIRGLSEVRSSISAKYAKIYPEPMASIISAMVIGDDSNLGEETKEIFLLTALAITCSIWR